MNILHVVKIFVTTSIKHQNLQTLPYQCGQFDNSEKLLINFQLTRVNRENSKKLRKTFLYIQSLIVIPLSDIRSFLFINFSERVQLIIIQRNLLIKMFSTYRDKRVLPTVAIQLVTTPILAEILQKNRSRQFVQIPMINMKSSSTSYQQYSAILK